MSVTSGKKKKKKVQNQGMCIIEFIGCTSSDVSKLLLSTNLAEMLNLAPEMWCMVNL